MKKHILNTISILTATLSFSLAQAEVPKTCKELSKILFTKVIQDFSENMSPIVRITIPDMSGCMPDEPMPYTFDCETCGIDVSVSYMASDKKCYTKSMAIFYKKGFTDLTLADMAMFPRSCE